MNFYNNTIRFKEILARFIRLASSFEQFLLLALCVE